MRNRNIFIEKKIYLNLTKNGQLTSEEYSYLQNLITKVAKYKVSQYLKGYAFIDDLVQDTVYILIFMIKRGGFHFDSERGLLAFIHTTVKYLLMKEQRLGFRLSSSPEEIMLLDQNNGTSQLFLEEIRFIMQKVLSEKAYKLIQMYLDGFDNHEIAEALGYKNAAVVANKKYEYREKLKVALTLMAA
jgi:DNA-directed RNA polymerase specialized sigma24 family protein